MPIRSETIALQNPAIASLPQVSAQLSFLYISDARIVQDSTGVVALSEDKGRKIRTSIPVASIAALLLGHGTSVTQPALATISKHGAAILWTGADATRTHGWSYSLTSSARWAEAQASAWADPSTRVQVAVAMYRKRFGTEASPGTTLRQLRGLEGQRMKSLYRDLANRYGIEFKRSYRIDDFAAADPVNQSLSAANAALYGVSLAATVALGCHPGLGFVHAGNISSFVFDIADLYKADVSIPAAFEASTKANPVAAARRLTREAIVEGRILTRAVSDIQDLLAPGLRSASPGESLLRDEDGFTEAGRLHTVDEPE